MKITIYELLGMIKDGKAPKKIKWRNEIYNLYEYESFINYEPESNGDWLLNQYLWKLNNEVEILETTLNTKDMNITYQDNKLKEEMSKLQSEIDKLENQISKLHNEAHSLRDSNSCMKKKLKELMTIIK